METAFFAQSSADGMYTYHDGIMLVVLMRPCFGLWPSAAMPAQSTRTGVHLSISAWCEVLRECLVEPISLVQDYVGALTAASGRVVMLFTCKQSRSYLIREWGATHSVVPRLCPSECSRPSTMAFFSP